MIGTELPTMELTLELLMSKSDWQDAPLPSDVLERVELIGKIDNALGTKNTEDMEKLILICFQYGENGRRLAMALQKALAEAQDESSRKTI